MKYRNNNMLLDYKTAIFLPFDQMLAKSARGPNQDLRGLCGERRIRAQSGGLRPGRYSEIRTCVIESKASLYEVFEACKILPLKRTRP